MALVYKFHVPVKYSFLQQVSETLVVRCALDLAWLGGPVVRSTELMF